jgi:hypothetical protein
LSGSAISHTKLKLGLRQLKLPGGNIACTHSVTPSVGAAPLLSGAALLSLRLPSGPLLPLAVGALPAPPPAASAPTEALARGSGAALGPWGTLSPEAAVAVEAGGSNVGLGLDLENAK